MAKFPNCSFSSFADFHRGYQTHLRKAQDSVDVAAVAHAAHLIEKAIKDDRTIFVCGNGGSAAIANHFVCDFVKGISTGTDLKPKVFSLDHLELITAYGNDQSYEDIFWRQLGIVSRPGDLLITISASGNSPNVCNAVDYMETATIAMIGFDGGDVAITNELNKATLIHVNGENYGVCEDVFQTIMHEIAQFIRQSNMDPDKIKETKF